MLPSTEEELSTEEEWTWEKSHLRINQGLVDDIGMIRISLHIYLPLGFCTLEVDAILNLRCRIKESKFHYGDESNGLHRFLLKQHYHR